MDGCLLENVVCSTMTAFIFREKHQPRFPELSIHRFGSLDELTALSFEYKTKLGIFSCIPAKQVYWVHSQLPNGRLGWFGKYKGRTLKTLIFGIPPVFPMSKD